MLVDHPDAVVEGIARRVDRGGLSAHQDLALVRVIDPGDHVHQRGLAAAVLAQHGQDLALPDGHADVPVGDDLLAEAFGHVA